MNNGANIVTLGATDLRRTFGDSITTSECNRSELSRRYFIHKHLKQTGRSLLIRGYKAPDFSNLYLIAPPRQTFDASHAYFDCVFSGILDIDEGGNGPLYERVERNSNIGFISSTISYTQAVLRYFYCLKNDAEDRSITRVIPLPTTVTARTTSGGTIIYQGTSFFWELYDKPRTNFDLYDEIIESWRLTFKA
jgi:hypothetical protein